MMNQHTAGLLVSFSPAWLRHRAVLLLLFVTHATRWFRFMRRGIPRIVETGRKLSKRVKQMRNVLWNVFGECARNRDVFLPIFRSRFNSQVLMATTDSLQRSDAAATGVEAVEGLGRTYRKGAIILQQGEADDALFVIQAGSVELVREADGHELCIGELGEGELIGEMALFDRNVHALTVRALSDVRLITIDRRVLLRKIHEDASLAFRIMNRMTTRITELVEECMYLSRARLEAAMATCETEIPGGLNSANRVDFASELLRTRLTISEQEKKYLHVHTSFLSSAGSKLEELSSLNCSSGFADSIATEAHRLERGRTAETAKSIACISN